MTTNSIAQQRQSDDAQGRLKMNLEQLVGKTIGERYQATQVLNTSRGGVDFLGVDLESTTPVVIKAIATSELAPGARMRLEHDATLRRHAPSPWLAPFIDWLRDDETLYFITRWIEGVTLAERLCEGPVALPDALTVGRCLFSALRDLHRHRVLHRDVRPANLVTGEGAVIVAATLTGFGAPDDVREGVLLREQELESAWYMSPEQAGSIDRDVAESSDLYSAGAVLFHCLAGRPPFNGENVSTVLFEHMTAHVPELRSLGLEVPRALDEIIERLLRKDPRDRYQTAEAVLEDLQTLTLAIQRGEQEPNLVIGGRDRRVTLTEPAFVARQQELHVLDEQLARATTGNGGLAVVEARSGDGKTRLLVELAQRATQNGVWVLRGQGSTDVGQRPFQLLEGVVERFVAAARSDPSLVESVQQKLGPLCDPLGAALPQLRAIFPETVTNNLAPEELGETRTLRALGEFLDALGDASRPVLLLLDDCQWADELTCKLIARWQKPSGTARPPRYAMLVTSFRSEEVGADHALRQLRSEAHVRLGPLAPSEVRCLAESMAGPLPDDAAEVVIDLSEGSPFMASAVLRGLVESGALIASPNGWRIEPLALDQLQSSNQAASFLTRRIELLPAATAALLSMGAVFGKEFDLNFAAALCGQTASQAIEAVDEARQRQLVWIRPDGGQCVFVHDKIRSALLERLSRPRRRELHRLAAMLIQREAPDRVSDLAYHFDAAGDAPNALHYALQAAESSRAQHSLEVAEQQYRIAQRGASQADRATQFRITEGLGDVLMLRGRYDAAARLFEQAAKLAEGKLAHAQIHEKLAELAFKRGDKERATQELEDNLRRLGRFVPRSLPPFFFLLVWEAVVQVLHSLFPRWLVHRVKSPPSDEVRLELRLYSRLTHSYWFTRGKTQTLWAHLRGMNLGERYPASLELASAYSEHAPVISLLPMFRRACKYSLRSLQIRQEFGDLWGQGQSLTFFGCVLYYSSRYHECIENCREAIRLLERMGDYWYVHIARYQLAASLYRLGDLRGAIEECRLNHKSGLELHDEQASSIILDVWTRAARGVLPEGVLQRELDRELQDAQGAAQIALAEGMTNLGADDPHRAANAFRRAIDIARRAGIKNAYSLPNLAWLVVALRLQAERHEPGDPAGRRRLLRQAARAARNAIQGSRICANDLPLVLREYALISAMQGKTRLAYRLFYKSLAIAHQHRARYEYAQTLLARGKIGSALGWPRAAEHLEEAEAILNELLPQPNELEPSAAGPVTLSLADRFDTVLDSGRKIASALSKSAIYDEARDAALRLLRGEVCRVVELDGAGGADAANRQPARTTAEELYDRRMVARAMRVGRAIAFSEELADATSDLGGAASETSALCVPIQVRGRTAACLYVAHHQVSGLFGPDEERLADFIAAIAGAALENAEGFHQLQTLNDTLEQRVAERTAAAESRARELALSNKELERVANELRRTEEQLRIASEAAESANRAKTRFLTTMSHEIRTPLNGILGMTELALQTALTPQQCSHLTTVKQSAKSLLMLLNDVLDLSKIEAGRMELETIPFDVREVIGGAVRLLAITAAQKGVELIARVAPEAPPELRGDPTRLRQVIVNLVGNAIKFTAEGDVFVNVFVDDQEGDALHVMVQDSGIGIPAEKQATIFQAFQQADSSTTRRYGGTGLGLAICSQLVSLMGGRIWVESEEGRGCTFHVVIPLQASSEPQASMPTAPSLVGMHVLWLSRHAINRRVYGEALASFGAAVTTLANVEDALAALETETGLQCYDAVVVDIAAPDAEECRLIEAVAGERHARLPLVTLVGAGKSCPGCDNADSGRLRVVSKPALAIELAETLLAAAGRRSSRFSDPSDEPEAQALPPLRILLAEDGLVNQEVAVGLLELAGHTVAVANHGREALEAYRRESFDVILMDLEMPEMDGLEATRRIRAYEAEVGRHTPIIAMTAHAITGFRDRCLDAGMDDYVTKPIELKELLRVVRTALENRSSGLAARC